jgi:hypothetical protein
MATMPEDIAEAQALVVQESAHKRKPKLQLIHDPARAHIVCCKNVQRCNNSEDLHVLVSHRILHDSCPQPLFHSLTNQSRLSERCAFYNHSQPSA